MWYIGFCHLATPFMASQPTPLRNKGLIAGLIEENQWLIGP